MAALINPLAYDIWPLPFYFAMRAREQLMEFIMAQLEQAKARKAAAAAGGGSAQGQQQGGEVGRRLTIFDRWLGEVDEEGNTLTDEEIADNVRFTHAG